jgi:FKBP-type peptidyl-prolyl cis-trans isomerase
MLNVKIFTYFKYFKISLNPKKSLFIKSSISCTFFILFFLITIKCSNPKNNYGYSKDSTGNYFQLLALGDGLIKSNSTDFIILDVELKTQKDSIFFNSQHSTKNGMIINLSDPEIKPFFINYFQKLVEGDSASILIAPTPFFNSFFDTLTPLFCINDSIIKFNFKIKTIVNEDNYQKLLGKQDEDKELLELKQIDNYLKKNYPYCKPNSYGIYQLEKKENHNQKIQLGNKIIVQYQGYFLDGKPLDSTPQKIELIYGTPDQFIKGLNIVIGSLKKGEFSKIIVPSRLAFGELGSSNQLVQPYTPLVYNLTLIDIK